MEFSENMIDKRVRESSTGDLGIVLREYTGNCCSVPSKR